MKPKQAGRLFGIGVGPGDGDLITLKAVNALKSLSDIFVPKSADGASSLAREIATPHLRDGCRVTELSFPMVKNRAALAAHWAAAAEPVAGVLNDGRDCAFLTLGDPMLFSTYIYLVRAVRQLAPGATVETIPGISSIFAAAAKAGLPLAEGEESVALLTGDAADSIEALAGHFSTIVIMKVGKRLPRIRALLRRLGLEEHSTLAHRVGLSGELITDIDTADKDSLGYLSTIIVRTGR